MKYRFAGKEKRAAFGAYPDVSLKKARLKRDKAQENPVFPLTLVHDQAKEQLAVQP